MAFVKKKYFSNIESKETYNQYIEGQYSNISRLGKRRRVEEYKIVGERISDIVDSSPYKNMICLGARNRWEGQCFKDIFENLDVKTLDLMPESGCDYIHDYSRLPEEWENKWDMIYTNAPDHALDGEAAFFEWLRVLNAGGILIFGISSQDLSETENTHDVTPLESCIYGTAEEVEDWFASQKNIEIIKKFGPLFSDEEKTNGSFNYFILKKK